MGHGVGAGQKLKADEVAREVLPGLKRPGLPAHELGAGGGGVEHGEGEGARARGRV